jgi:tRNA pseudouridine55 synthase
MANGILIVDKPQEWTSMDVCAKLRGIFHEKRVGHGGTLDPMATGVLPVFLGRATRAVEFAAQGDKEYIAGLRLGVVTNTQDVTGEILSQNPVQVSREQLEAVLSAFQGEILQVPPMYSAIKIQGKKLYELARKGREVDRPPRPVTLHSLTVEDQTGPSEFVLRVHCSKGTYVRTLCHDIGQKLGCGGTMSTLRRVKASGFTLQQAVTLEEIQACQDPAALLLGVDTLFTQHPALDLEPAGEKKIRNGMTLPLPGTPEGIYRVYGQSRQFLALCQLEQGKLKTIKSFFEV